MRFYTAAGVSFEVERDLAEEALTRLTDLEEGMRYLADGSDEIEMAEAEMARRDALVFDAATRACHVVTVVEPLAVISEEAIEKQIKKAAEAFLADTIPQPVRAVVMSKLSVSAYVDLGELHVRVGRLTDSFRIHPRRSP